MYGQFTMIVRFAVLLLAVTVSTRVDSFPALVILLFLAGALVLVPALRHLVLKLLRLAATPPHGPPRVGDADPPDVHTPADPGVPGSVRARAPSPGVHAFA